MSKEQQSALLNNIFWFVASLVIAMIIWFIAKIEADPIGQRLFTRPINIIVDDEMIITERSSDNARVFVNAQQSNLTILQQDDITVTADLQGQPAGRYTIPLDVDVSRLASADTQPAQIIVEIEQRISQQVGIEVDIDAPPVNYAAGTVEREFFQAVVSGATANVNQVSRIVGDLDLSNQQSASVVERTLTLYAEDANGNRVNDVTIEPASIIVTVPVAQRENTRTFAVRPNIQFATLPDNYVFRNNGFSYEPNTVIINASSPQVLDALGDTIDTVPISLEDRTSDFSVEVALDLPEDEDLIILSESSTVMVNIAISEETTTLLLENIPIQPIGFPENNGLSMTVNPLNVSVLLTGAVSVIDTITLADIQVVIDLNNLEVGTHLVTPQIEIRQGQINLEADNVRLIPEQVSVTISEPQAEETTLPETTAEPDSTPSTDD